MIWGHEMRLEFTPRETRKAVNRLAQMFASVLTPQHSLQELFAKVARLDIHGLRDFSKRIRGAEMDLVCDNYHQAKDARTLTGIAGLLAFQQDRRFFAVLRLAFFFMPSAREADLAQALWLELKGQVPTAAHDGWLVAYITSDPPVDPLPHAIASMAQRQLDLARLGDRFYRTPLFRALTDHLFAEGVSQLKVLTAEPAGVAAEDYLRKGDLVRVQNYLSHYPAEHWQPAFLEELVLKMGAPIQSNAFYKSLDEGVLWGLRQRLFRARLRYSHDARAHETFWLGKLHYLSNLEATRDSLRIEFGPFHLRETANETWVRHKSWSADRVIVHDEAWEGAVEDLFRQVVGW